MSATQNPRLRALILAGGQSSRMGFAKYLLPMPVAAACTSSRPLLLHLLDILDDTKRKHPDHFTECVTISARDQAQHIELQQLLKDNCNSPNVAFEVVVDAVANAGPAQGLLAAYELDKTTHWLVVGCDYPLLSLDAVEQLITAYQASRNAVICFQNNQGFAEPLLSIWSPSSLMMLADLAENVSPSVGPNQVIKTLQRTGNNYGHAEPQERAWGVQFVRPLDPNWIRSVDTRDQWKAVEDLLKPFP